MVEHTAQVRGGHICCPTLIVIRLRLPYRNVTEPLRQVYDFPASLGLSSRLDETMIVGSQVSSPAKKQEIHRKKKDGRMNRFKNFLLDAISVKHGAENRMKRYGLAMPIAIIGLMFVLTTHAQNPAPLTFTLVPASNAVGNCLPDATARVTVFPKEDIRGVDTLDLKAEGLPAHTTFAVFLTERPTGNVGAVQYIGDFTTNAAGRGSLRVDAIIEEAFAFNNITGVRKELDHVVIWFADPNADEFCVTGSASTPFEGNGQAGIAVLSSKNALPGAPLP